MHALQTIRKTEDVMSLAVTPQVLERDTIG